MNNKEYTNLIKETEDLIDKGKELLRQAEILEENSLMDYEQMEAQESQEKVD
jgi:hypothetical protein